MKPVMTDDKGKGPVEIKDAKKAIEDDMPLGEGPFDQEFGAGDIGFTTQLERLWVIQSWTSLSAS